MDTLQIQNNICQTIDIIVQNAINNAGFDRTIQAVIMECVNESIGQYKIQYQDSTFYAYAQNPEDKYSAGSGVYILIQNNDMKRDKFIVGTVDKLGKDYLTIVDESERYEMIGINCVSNVEEIQLCSYDSLYYEKDIMNTLSINELDLLTYCENAEFLAIKMNIRTALEREQRRLGNYGLKITLAFKNKEETYKIDINSMIGDPYNYIDYMSQFFVLKFNMENFIGIKNITVFCENFPKQKENMPNDIFIDNLEIYAADRLNEEELRSPRLKFYTPRGTIFKEDLPVTAYLNINDQNINKGEFFWFIEDATIDTNSPYFLPIGGKGWKCINIFDIIKNEEEEYLEVQPFETGYRLFEVDKHLAKHTKYKCVMRYNNDIYTKEIVLQNKQSNYSIFIESSDGKTFHNDVGQTVLTCKVLDGELPMSNCIYKWSSIDNNNYINQLQNNTSNITVSAASIDYFTIYKCMVYTLVENEEVLIGSSEIMLTNSIGSEGTYHLIINNDSQTFIYNEEGISPANKNLENPMTILPLNFILYDAQGQEVPREKIYEENVEWKIPALNSLIQLNEIIAAKDGYYYKNTYDLHFGIKPIYSVNAVNNQIELTIKYQDLVLKAFANLLFTKEGDVGTNGTGVLTRIHAIEKDDSFILQNEEPMMYYNKTKGTYEKNYKELQAIVAEGDQVLTIYPEYSDNTNCNWGILKNRIDSQNLDDSHFDYTLGAGFSQKYNSTLENVYRIANVINAKITYNNIQYFSVFPMITAFIEDDNYIPYLKKNTGFRSIKYSSDGRYPKYNSALPFTIGIKNNKGKDIDIDSFRFKWGTSTAKTGENTFKYKPQDQYDGRAVNESLICTIYNSSGTQIAKVFIPIYMYLNTYGYSALNDWHGNSIEINNDGGYILTPQIGAGIKNADNTFTGLLMGEMVNGEDKKSGLIGLYNGVQSIFLDSQTGRAEFGKAGAGQIILDPSRNEAIIQSGNFSTSAKSGMQINLSEPTITFGSGHFSVNKEGKLTANKGSIAGIVMDNDYGLYTNDKTSAVSTKAGFLIQKTGNIYLGSYNTQLKSCPLELTSDGNLKAYQGIIGGWTIKSNYLYSKGTSTTTGISSDMNKYAFWAGETNNVMGANNSNAKFRVDHNGNLFADNAKLSGNITATSGQIGAMVVATTRDAKLHAYSHSLTTTANIKLPITLRVEKGDGYEKWDPSDLSVTVQGGMKKIFNPNELLFYIKVKPTNISEWKGAKDATIFSVNAEGEISCRGLIIKNYTNLRAVYLNDSNINTNGLSHFTNDNDDGSFLLRTVYDDDTNENYIEINMVKFTTAGIISSLKPANDNKYYLGTSSYKWQAVYAVKGTIQTSDRNLKHHIQTLSEKHKQFFMKLVPVSFLFTYPDSDRTHIGFIAQDVEEAMEQCGLTALDFAGFCKDIKQEKVSNNTFKNVYDENGEPVYIYSLRYTEFIGIITYVLQDTVKKVDDLYRLIEKKGE